MTFKYLGNGGGADAAAKTGDGEMAAADAPFQDGGSVAGDGGLDNNYEDNSADSQFFICYDRLPGLDDKYTVWGRVVRGMEFVDLIPEGVPPVKPGKIVKMRINTSNVCACGLDVNQTRRRGYPLFLMPPSRLGRACFFRCS